MGNSGGMFGKEKTPQEQMREHKRTIDKAVRELDRERTALERQEKKLTTDIKKMAKSGQMGAAKIMAKDLVRTRGHITKFYEMRSQLQAIGLRLQSVKSTHAMSQAMSSTTKVMASMNKQFDMPALQRIMMEFQKQSEKMDMTQEMVGDAVDGAMEAEGDEEESEAIVNQVLEEVLLDKADKMGSVPLGGAGVADEEKVGPSAVAAGGGGDDPDAELEARFNNLKGK